MLVEIRLKEPSPVKISTIAFGDPVKLRISIDPQEDIYRAECANFFQSERW